MSDRLRRQHRFTVTPEHLILDPRVKDRDFRLWCRLDRYIGADESAFPSRESLAIELDCSPSSIDRAAKNLIDSGWLLREERDGTSSLYTLVVAPEKEVERLIKAARKQRVKDTAPRREAAAARRKAAKKKARGTDAVESKNMQVSEGGLTTGDEPQIDGGFTTGDEPGFTTDDERGFTTGDEQKEAPLEGSIIEGSSDSSLRSSSAATESTSQPADESSSLLTETETETGRDADGKPLKGKKLDALAQSVTAAWWDWIEPAGHSKPTNSFLACRGVIRSALGNGIAPKDVKRALVVLTTEGRVVSANTLGIAMNLAAGPGGKTSGRRAYRDADEWADRPTQPQHDPWAEPA